jgi:hypothetical protein
MPAAADMSPNAVHESPLLLGQHAVIVELKWVEVLAPVHKDSFWPIRD